MFKNWLTVALRNLRRQKGYSFLTIFGLAVGMAGSILILLYLRDELGYDRYAPHADRIFRLAIEAQTPNRGALRTARTPSPWAPVLVQDYPEVEGYVRFKTPLVSWLVGNESNDRKFHERGFYFADPGSVRIFGWRMLRGDPETALTEPNSLILTRSAAARYFGSEDPLGKILRLDNTYDFAVTGVIEDVPRNSHITFDILASFASLDANPIYGDIQNGTMERNGLAPQVYTYLLLRVGTEPSGFEAKLPGFVERYLGSQLAPTNIEVRPFLQPLTSIHLRSDIDAELGPNSSIGYIYIFSAVAFFILAIACINFMNLATARSAARAQEVGLRKIVGAERGQIIRQFLGESFFLSCLSLGLALLLTWTLLPVFGSLSGKELSLRLSDPWLLTGLVGIILFTGFFSGSYPALYLSGFLPGNILRGSIKAGRTSALLRKILVVFQFAISVVFIIGTVVVYRQLRFIGEKPLGFSKENVVILRLGDPRARPLFQSFKERALQDPGVLSVTAATSFPGGLPNTAFLRPEGAPPGEQIAVEFNMVDYGFLETLGIELSAGRDFSRDYPTDRLQAYIFNEAAVRAFGWADDPLGKQIPLGDLSGRVIGVVRDFHTESLHNRIDPLVLHLAPSPDPLHFGAVRISPENVQETLAFLESRWREVYPHDPFVYSFLEDDLGALYRNEALRGRIFVAFSVLTIIIASLGLLGLASFSAERRAKEIGIRKVLGARVSGLVGLLAREFIGLVLLANAIAWPLAYFFMHRWLRGFAYRTSLDLWIFPLVALMACVIAILTVGFQALRAALADPVAAIRTE